MEIQIAMTTLLADHWFFIESTMRLCMYTVSRENTKSGLRFIFAIRFTKGLQSASECALNIKLYISYKIIQTHVVLWNNE